MQNDEPPRGKKRRLDEYFVAFSCKQRGFCPSCAAKRAALWAEFAQAKVIRPVPHRHLVFALPKALRTAFRYRRPLLPKPAVCAWKTVAGYVRDAIFEPALPAAVVAIPARPGAGPIMTTPVGGTPARRAISGVRRFSGGIYDRENTREDA